MAKPPASITRRVRAAILLVSITVLVATAIAFVLYELLRFKSELVRSVSTLAAVTANNVAAAVQFETKESAEELLAALRADPDIVAAVLYTNAGVFATYPARLDPKLLPRQLSHGGHRFERDSLILFRPVDVEGKEVGTVFVRCSLSAFYRRFWNYGGIVGAVLACAVAAAFVLSNLFQRRISEPILALSSTTRSIAERGDYSVRAEKRSADEVGVLTDSFNHMLEQIQQRDRALRDSEQALERTVEERTAALRETVQQLETFSYSLVHDMRAPLRTMHSFAGILQEEEGANLSPEGRDFLARIMSGATRLDSLINDVLTYSRVSKGEASLDVVSLDRIVSDVIREYPDLHVHEGNIHVQHPLPNVVGNAALLTQCVSNLLANAVKFVPNGQTPRVVVRAEEGASKVRLWVEDNGIGIAREHSKNLFGLFERLTGSAQYPGTGVGLAIVKRAVERMNGEIGFESEPGKGTRFWIELPKS